MEPSTSRENRVIFQMLSKAVFQQQPHHHPTDWPKSIAHLWIHRFERLRGLHADLLNWMLSHRALGKEDMLVLEGLICCLPSSSLVAFLLSEKSKPRKKHGGIISLLSQSDDAFRRLEIQQDWIETPLSSLPLRRQCGYGDTPLGIVAARLGRPEIIAGSQISMSMQERKSLVCSASELGLLKPALLLCSNAPPGEKMTLSALVWKTLSGSFSLDLLPDCDPPLLWWDRVIKQTPRGEYHDNLAGLVRMRTHLSQDLAAAMLRSGIREVKALSHAQPGLAANDRWPGMDGNMLPAIGVVIDSWISALKGKIPTALERKDLMEKLILVSGCLPQDILDQPSCRNWAVLGAALIGEPAHSAFHPPKERKGCHCLIGPPPSYEDIEKALMEEWEANIRHAPCPTWQRFIEIAVFSLMDPGGGEQTSFATHLDRMLPLFRCMFTDAYLGASTRDEQKKVEGVMKQFLALPFLLPWSGGTPQTANLEWEIWNLFFERSEATSGWRSKKGRTSRSARMLGSIEIMSDGVVTMGWDERVVVAVHHFLGDDQALPEWFQSLIEKEVLRTTTVEGEATPLIERRGRL